MILSILHSGMLRYLRSRERSPRSEAPSILILLDSTSGLTLQKTRAHNVRIHRGASDRFGILFLVLHRDAFSALQCTFKCTRTRDSHVHDTHRCTQMPIQRQILIGLTSRKLEACETHRWGTIPRSWWNWISHHPPLSWVPDRATKVKVWLRRARIYTTGAFR